jgi:hypothetical protein
MAISVPPKGDADKKIGADLAPLSVQAQDTPSMTVKIRAGWFYNTNGDATEYSGGNSPTITPPGSNSKWVIVAINNSGSIVLVNGTAAASPTLPALPEGHMPLAFVYVTSSTTSITNEKVFDARPILRGADVVPNLDNELADRPTFTDMNNALATRADITGTPEYTFYLNNDDLPAADAMYAVKRGVSLDVGIRWNESLDKWQFTNDGTSWLDIAAVSGSFMPLQLLAVSGNIGVFNGVGEVVDSLQSLTGMATDAEIAAAVAAHAADVTLHLTVAQNTLLDGLAVTLTAAELNFVDGVTSAIQTQLDSKATDTLVVHLAGPETITGVKTFTAMPVFQAGVEFESLTDSFVTFSKGLGDDAGIIVDRSLEVGPPPNASIEWDETTDQWMAGTIGFMSPIVTAGAVNLDDLADVVAPAPAANDVLRFVLGQWVNDPLTDKVDVAGDTMTGDLAMGGTQSVTGLRAATVNGEAVRYNEFNAAIAQPANRVVLGTGTNLSSAATFTYNSTSGGLDVNTGFAAVAAPGDLTLIAAPGTLANDGGDVYVQGGNSVTGVGGDIVLAVGTGGTAGVIQLAAGWTLQVADDLRISGDPGSAGEMMVSNGTGAVPAWKTLAEVPSNVASILFAASPYAVPVTVEVVLADATAGAITVDLPSPALGRRVVVKKTDASANAVTVDPFAAETIDGGPSFGLPAQYDAVTVVSDGTNWFVI